MEASPATEGKLVKELCCEGREASRMHLRTGAPKAAVSLLAVTALAKSSLETHLQANC